MAGTLISNYANLNNNYTVPVVGEIPSGYVFGFVAFSSLLSLDADRAGGLDLFLTG